MNNGQPEIGSGGNGGAVYSDGASLNVLLCGDQIINNAAGTNAFGGGLFFTSNDFGGTLTIADTTMTGNTGGHWTQVSSGSVTDAGTAVGTNAKSITINSTLSRACPEAPSAAKRSVRGKGLGLGYWRRAWQEPCAACAAWSRLPDLASAFQPSERGLS